MNKQKLIEKPNSKALILRNKINRLKRREEKLSEEIYNNINELQNICIHDDYHKEETYIEGSYLDREESHISYICNVCGKDILTEVKYGGYG